MTTTELQSKLDELRHLPAETEWVEFKEAKNSFDFDDLGKYFSALSNEANLKQKECAWLVLGVANRPPRNIVSTNFKPTRPALDALKAQVASHTGSRLTFEEIYELHSPEGRVLLFQIPPALRGIPTCWKGHHYGREGESLGPLNTGEFEAIRRQTANDDWSAHIVPEASISDLDERALQLARTLYRERHPHQAPELTTWDDVTFLNKAKLFRNGKATRAALLLLGKPESDHFLLPAHAQITWIVRSGAGKELDFRHFGPPFLLAGDLLLKQIRNLTVRHLPHDSLFPLEVSQYEPWVIRETLYNCIAHQDYAACSRINVVESPDSLLFTNRGSFLPGSVEAMIQSDAPPDRYRNPFLAHAMVNLKMIETIGSGIRKMFTIQRDRSFPLPDYDLSEPDKVSVRLAGTILDENYTRLLLRETDLELLDVIALDKVQKKRPIDDETLRHLRSLKLVEGRRSNLFVSAKVAKATGDKAAYIKNRAFDRQYYKDAVCRYLQEFGSASLKDLENLLLAKLSDALDERQKQRYIKNLLQSMKEEGTVRAEGGRRWARWRLHNSLTTSSDSG